jgi:Mce-associated membrane protein
MPTTTRHSLNTLRRRQARETLRTQAAPDALKGRGEPRDRPQPTRAHPSSRTTSASPRSRRPLAALCLLTLLLGGFAGWAHARAESLRDTPAARNTALSDTARTSEIKGATSKAVGALFSYDHADPAAFDKAAKEWLTGRAVAQHRDLFAAVRTQADQQKAVITTTVTDSAVERIDGDRARVLVYADQSSVSTAGDKKADDDGSYAGAMLAVDVQRRDGRWLVSGIDTFGR